MLSLVFLQTPDPAAVWAPVPSSCPPSLWAASENSKDEMEVFVSFTGGTYPSLFLATGSSYLTIYKFMSIRIEHLWQKTVAKNLRKAVVVKNSSQSWEVTFGAWALDITALSSFWVEWAHKYSFGRRQGASLSVCTVLQLLLYVEIVAKNRWKYCIW